jgi:hypothetical protein
MTRPKPKNPPNSLGFLTLEASTKRNNKPSKLENALHNKLEAQKTDYCNNTFENQDFVFQPVLQNYRQVENQGIKFSLQKAKIFFMLRSSFVQKRKEKTVKAKTPQTPQNQHKRPGFEKPLPPEEKFRTLFANKICESLHFIFSP